MSNIIAYIAGRTTDLPPAEAPTSPIVEHLEREVIALEGERDTVADDLRSAQARGASNTEISKIETAVARIARRIERATKALDLARAKLAHRAAEKAQKERARAREKADRARDRGNRAILKREEQERNAADKARARREAEANEIKAVEEYKTNIASRSVEPLRCFGVGLVSDERPQPLHYFAQLHRGPNFGYLRAVSAPAMSQKTLLDIAPNSYWTKAFPAFDDPTSVDWDLAISTLLERSNEVGTFDVSMRRGRGVFLDTQTLPDGTKRDVVVYSNGVEVVIDGDLSTRRRVVECDDLEATYLPRKQLSSILPSDDDLSDEDIKSSSMASASSRSRQATSTSCSAT